MKEHEVQFGTLHPDGSLTNIRHIKQRDMLACPYCIMMPDHYREDGSCKCDDPTEQAKMIKEWGYKKSDFKRLFAPKKTPKVRFEFLIGDVDWVSYGGKWVSQKLNSGEFDYWLVLELINMDDAVGRDNMGQPKYHVCVSAVSPQEAGQEGLEKAVSCCGLREDEEADPLMQVEALHSYGISSPVWQGSGNNSKLLIREAKRQAQIHGVDSFEESMRRPVNAIGSTGLEILRGDITAGLARTISSGSPEGKVLGKIYGVKEAK
jgi:hypothetical protein